MSNSQRGVDVGACGPSYNPGHSMNPNGAELGLSGIPNDPDNYACRTPPRLPPRFFVQDGAVYSDCFVPFGFRFGVDADGFFYPEDQIGLPANRNNSFGTTTLVINPPNGTYNIGGFKTFTAPDTVLLESVQTGDSDMNQLVGNVDAGAWNTDECFCIARWGCISVTNGARIQARSIATNANDGLPNPNVQEISGGFYGLRRQSLYACGPNYSMG